MKKITKVSLKTIFLQYNEEIYKYIFLRVGYRKEVAEDLAQEVFLRVWKYRRSFNHKKSSIRTWLYTITRNCVVDYFQKNGKKKEVEIGEYEPEDVFNLEQDVEKQEMLNLILDGMNLLKPNDRDLINLRYIQGFSLKEVAELVDRDYDNVKVAVHRALNKLRGILNSK